MLKPEQVRELPNRPGVYKFYNRESTLVYVGKAKDLKKRVSSYFNKQTGVNRKTRKLVSEIEGIEYTVVNSEFDAFLLENNLIKTHQPRYNILLKDDKSFPFICITRELYPKMYSTRRVKLKTGEYYGPYANAKAMRTVMELIRNLYHIRTCSLPMAQENIDAGKFKVCLEYHLGNCLGPCEGLQSAQDYNKEIDEARNILKGNISVVKKSFQNSMEEAAANLQFELAQKFKDKLELLEKFQSKTLIVNPTIKDTDVLTILSDEKSAIVNYLKIHNGYLMNSESVEIKKKLEESDEELLMYAALELREKYQSEAMTLLTNVPITLGELESAVPQRGDKKKLIELSLKNALFFKKQKMVTPSKATQAERVLQELKLVLQLKDLPDNIECFDNSNFQGTSPVASMVSFRGGKPSKKDYRHYNVKTVEGPDDFASMHEIVTRRYKRLMEEEKPLPNLIIIDGGKGQLNAGAQALKQIGLYGKIPIVGIAKRLEEIYVPADPYPLHIDKKSEALKLMQHIRDEAHRFAITFHRQKRSSKSLNTVLREIPGVGPKTVDQLLGEFKSVKNIREANVTQLASVIGLSRAKKVHDFLKIKKEA